jgi:hypothetical protein
LDERTEYLIMGCDGCLPPRWRPIAGFHRQNHTPSSVWAASAYRSAKNEKHLADNGLGSHIHRKKPEVNRRPEAVAQANGKKSKVRAYVEHVFAQQRARWIWSFGQSASPGPE